ncbi:hypothetical protein C8R44DRAFT_746095 [Mycena epipterygia]|nr:hypothetical protein C8R44DRAFT_746095 [Mycena epipterygia]
MFNGRKVAKLVATQKDFTGVLYSAHDLPMEEMEFQRLVEVSLRNGQRKDNQTNALPPSALTSASFHHVRMALAPPDIGRSRHVGYADIGGLNQFTLVDNVLSEILNYADTRTLLQVALVSRNTQNFASDALYRKICVSAFCAGQLCQTLAALKQRAERVIALRIRHKDAGMLHGTAFEAAFANMKHLQTLHLEVPVDTRALLRSFTGSLTTFTSSQPEFHCIDVSPGLLPNLIRVRAPPRDVESLVPGRPVRHVRFHYTPQDAKLRPTVQLGFFLGCTVPLLRLDLMACQLINQPDLETLFSELRHLTVFQDDTWGKRCGSRNLEDELWFMADATSDLPKLRTLVIVTTLTRKKALMIYDAVKTYSAAPRLHVLAIHTRDRCMCWSNFLEAAMLLKIDIDDCEHGV